MSINASRITIQQGEDVTIQVSVIDDNAAAVNITGFNFQADIRIEREGAVQIITKSSGSGITITDGAGGVYEIILSSADTKKLRVPATYFWDTWRTDNGKKAQLAYGELEVLGSAVQP